MRHLRDFDALISKYLWFCLWQRWRKRLPSLPLPGLPDNFLFQAQFLPIPPPPSSSQLLSVPHKYLVENNRQPGWPSDRRWATWRGAPTSQNHSSLWQLISCESLRVAIMMVMSLKFGKYHFNTLDTFVWFQVCHVLWAVCHDLLRGTNLPRDW